MLMTRGDFLKRYRNDPRVAWWLGRNPPPRQWEDSPEAWAFLEMPVFWLMLPRWWFS